MMKKVILSLAFAAIALSAGAQRVVLKNNVVYDALATPNLGIELGLGRATTLDYPAITTRSRNQAAKCSNTG